jgi:flagellin
MSRVSGDVGVTARTVRREQTRFKDGIMGLRINNNIAAQNAYRNLPVTDGQTAKWFDAAGLSISEYARPVGTVGLNRLAGLQRPQCGIDEFAQLNKELDRIARTTAFGGQKLLDVSGAPTPPRSRSARTPQPRTRSRSISAPGVQQRFDRNRTRLDSAGLGVDAPNLTTAGTPPAPPR